MAFKQKFTIFISKKDHEKTAVLSEVFHELSTATFRYERERVLKDTKQSKAFASNILHRLNIYL